MILSTLSIALVVLFLVSPKGLITMKIVSYLFTYHLSLIVNVKLYEFSTINELDYLYPHMCLN